MNAGTRGAFITVEGADGAGKTTQIEGICQWLDQQQIPCVRTREPGGTEAGEQLRALLLDRQGLSLSAETELLMVFAARQQHLDELIRPALAANTWVVCDRFTDASYAYQGGGGGIDPARIDTLANWVQQGLEPDLTLVLDLDVDLGAKRSRNRDAAASEDRFETRGTMFKRAVRATYLDRIRQYPDRMKRVDASLDVEAVSDQIREILTGFMESWSGNISGRGQGRSG